MLKNAFHDPKGNSVTWDSCSSALPGDLCRNHWIIHSEKFKMNEDIDSFLSEKISNLLLT